MTDQAPSHPQPARAPLSYWVVALALLLWNAWGLFGAVAAQIRLIPELPGEAAAYFEQQPLWFMILADLSPLAGVAGSLALLVQSRWAPRLYLAQLGVLLAANGYEVIIGRSLLITAPQTWLSTAILVAVLAAQTAYAWRMEKRGLLS